MKNIKKEDGITLIALVITIIVLLILAGVTIATLTGENGLLGKAQNAAEQNKYAQAEEKVKLAVIASYETDGKINDNSLKENINNIEGLEEKVETISYDLTIKVDGYEFKISKLGQVTYVGKAQETKTEAGKEVALEENWKTETMRYVETSDGKEVTELTKVATVYAVSDGAGNKVPVPYGFYYVGGTINTGVVISDNVADKNKYVGYTPTGEVKEGIPSGVAYNADGTINAENSELKGNQFVWIPVSASEYVKKDWKKSNVTWERQTNTAELPQIQKYGGFYIGRYESGTSNISLSTGINFATPNTESGWMNDDFSIRDELKQTVTGKITLKAGEIPYYHADYETALKLSNSMYQTDYVQSGLVTGTMWDAMMKFIAGNNDTVVTSSPWGNYDINKDTTNVKYTAGIGRYAGVDSGNVSSFTKSDGLYHYGIKTTAVSEDVKKKNLYDVAGNLWEWTQEASYFNNTVETYIARGGCFNNSYSDNSACYRDVRTATETSTVLRIPPSTLY